MTVKGGKKFEKGHHVGRKELPKHLKGLKINSEHVRKIIIYLLQKTPAELKAIADGGLTPIMEANLALIMLRAWDGGRMSDEEHGRDDVKRMGFILDHAIGKVKEELHIEPQVVINSTESREERLTRINQSLGKINRLKDVDS